MRGSGSHLTRAARRTRPVFRNLTAILLAVVIGVSLSGCEKAAEVAKPLSYEKEGVSFQFPSNWTVTEDVTEDDFRYIFVESPGDSIFIFHIYAEGDEMDLREYAEWFSGEMKVALPIGTPGESTFTPTERETGAGRLEGLLEDLPVTFLGERVDQKHEYVRIEAGGRVVYLIASAPAEDLELVAPGFDLIFRGVRIEASEPTVPEETEDGEVSSDSTDLPHQETHPVRERMKAHRDRKE